MRSLSYCSNPDNDGLTCDLANLEVVQSLKAYQDESSRNEERIYRCRTCGGLYKYILSEVYDTRNYDSDEGWRSLVDHYYKVEEAGSGGAPFSIDEARTYGYVGDDFMMAGGRCGYPRQANGLTCRFSNLFEVAALDDNRWIKRCTKCGQFYLQIREPAGHRFYKPGEKTSAGEEFTLEQARSYGFEGLPRDEATDSDRPAGTMMRKAQDLARLLVEAANDPVADAERGAYELEQELRDQEILAAYHANRARESSSVEERVLDSVDALRGHLRSRGIPYEDTDSGVRFRFDYGGPEESTADIEWGDEWIQVSASLGLTVPEESRPDIAATVAEFNAKVGFPMWQLQPELAADVLVFHDGGISSRTLEDCLALIKEKLGWGVPLLKEALGMYKRGSALPGEDNADSSQL